MSRNESLTRPRMSPEESRSVSESALNPMAWIKWTLNGLANTWRYIAVETPHDAAVLKARSAPIHGLEHALKVCFVYLSLQSYRLCASMVKILHLGEERNGSALPRGGSHPVCMCFMCFRRTRLNLWRRNRRMPTWRKSIVLPLLRRLDTMRPDLSLTLVSSLLFSI